LEAKEIKAKIKGKIDPSHAKITTIADSCRLQLGAK
jgi:hypothetical protein